MRISGWSSDVCSSDLLLDPGQEAAMLADWRGRGTRVFVDAPCSGSGPWRRSAELRRRLTDRKIAVEGKSVPVRVNRGGHRIITTHTHKEVRMVTITIA